MNELLVIHPMNPQPRQVSRAVDVIRNGGVVIYPTDSCYALGCHVGDKAAMERIHRIRQTDRTHNFTLVLRDLSAIGEYARVDNWAYRLLRAHTPGPFTFILRATGSVPRRLQNPRRKTIGIRVPDHPITQALLAELAEPIMSSTLILPDESLPMTDPVEIHEKLAHTVDLVIDGGQCGIEPTTVIEMYQGEARLVRQGRGHSSVFET